MKKKHSGSRYSREKVLERETVATKVTTRERMDVLRMGGAENERSALQVTRKREGALAMGIVEGKKVLVLPKDGAAGYLEERKRCGETLKKREI